MDRIIPWAELSGIIEPFYPKPEGAGRRPIGVERMLRIYFLQHWFQLSDLGAEEALYDSRALRMFVGIDLGQEPVPDESTILQFRHLMEAHELGAQLFAHVAKYLAENGLKKGLISKEQFLDLNQTIGGYDRDDNYVPERTIADEHAIVEAYRSGVQLGGSGGLASVPLIDLSGTTNEDRYYHYQWYHFAVRARLLAANGDSDNHVMWRGDYESFYDNQVSEKAFDLINRWVTSVKADLTTATSHRKVIRNRPEVLVDGCWSGVAPVHFIAEKQVFGREPSTRCNALWPSYAFARFVAGGPLAADKLKCVLKPIDASDYSVTFSAAEMARLRAIFPDGVCDWSKPGLFFGTVQPGISYGPTPSIRN